MNWWWSRNHCIEPVRPHVSMPTVNVEFRALKPGVFPSKPRPQVKRLIEEQPEYWEQDLPIG